jgi:hypothetical protein
VQRAAVTGTLEAATVCRSHVLSLPATHALHSDTAPAATVATLQSNRQ